MKDLIPILIQAALFLLVSSVALRAQWRDVLAAANNPAALAKGVLAVNIVVPLVAVIVCSLLPIEAPIKTGIVIMAVSPLAPLVPGKLLKAGMSASEIIGSYVALILVAIVMVPATVALLSAYYSADAAISVAAVVKIVAVGVLLPVAFGLAVAGFSPQFAEKLAKPFGQVGNIAILAVLVLILYAKGGDIMSLVGDGAVAAIAVTTLAGLAAGHFLGGPDRLNRVALALAATTRHPGIALLIAKSNFDDDRVGLAVILYLLASVVVAALYQLWVKRSAPPAQTVG